MGTTGPLTGEERDWFLANPRGGYPDFLANGFDRSKGSFDNHRARLADDGLVERLKFYRRDALAPKPGAPDVRQNKADISFDGGDLLDLAIARQEQHAALSQSLDFPEFFIESAKPVPILFVADWHVGSWGTNHKAIKETLAEIKRLNLKIAVLGDMLQMAINMRSLLEVTDNMLRPSEQTRWNQWFVEQFHPQILWVTWDNHTIMRQEKVLGYSDYAELMKDKVVYSSGINHVDLMVGGADFETYRIASSHRFRGRSMYNALHGQQQYMRLEGPDREICVAGDSHRPAVSSYYDGPVKRAAINVGTTQTTSGYARRFFSLYTHDDMPLVEFWPDCHAFQVYDNLAAYKRQLALRQAA